MISQTAEYSLRAVVFLAAKAGGAYTTEQVAKGTKVPAAYLSKVLQSLAKTGIVQSQRGLRGGFLLTRRPEELTMLEVLNAVDPIQRISVCPLGLAEPGGSLCKLHNRLDEAAAMVEGIFATTSIAQLLTVSLDCTKMCTFPNEISRLESNGNNKSANHEMVESVPPCLPLPD